MRTKSSGGAIDLALVVGCLVAQAWTTGHPRPILCPARVGRGVSSRNPGRHGIDGTLLNATVNNVI